MALLQNIAVCYINLELFEDSLEFANKALDLGTNNFKSIFLKSKALTGLHEFSDALMYLWILETKQKTRAQGVFDIVQNELEITKLKENQSKGDFSQFLNSKDYGRLHHENFINFVQSLEIKISKGKGRGLFATRNIYKGDLLIAEKAIANGKPSKSSTEKTEISKINISVDEKAEIINKCYELAQLKGVQALRLSYLHDGEFQDLKIPPIDIFVKNKYKNHKIPEISLSQIERIVETNAFVTCSDKNLMIDKIQNCGKRKSRSVTGQKQKTSSCLFCLISFINHNDISNIESLNISDDISLLYASKDISRGEEIFIDYCQPI